MDEWGETRDGLTYPPLAGVGMLGIVVAILVLLLVLPAQLRTRPILVRQLVVFPLALTLIGLLVLLWERPPVGGAQSLYLGAQLTIAVVSGLARAAAVDVHGRRGYAVREGSWWLPVGWLLTIAARFALDGLTVTLASSAPIVATFPLFVGITLDVQSAAIYLHVRRRGLRFISPETLRRWRNGRQHFGEQGSSR